MATSTTIRVSVETRDRLAAQAQSRGIAIGALLTELIVHAEREAAFRVERAATRAEAAAHAVLDEHREWDTTLSDGLD